MEPTTLNQVGMLLECADLESNGYQCVIQHAEENWWFLKYRHRSNGRTLTVQWRPDRYTIKERNLILKSVGE